MKKLLTTITLFASLLLTACGGVKQCEEGQHKFGKWETVTAATCKAEGKQQRECEVCHYKETRDVDKTAHKWDQGLITTPATCSVPGVKTFTCTVCQQTKTEPVLAEHDLQPYEYAQGEGAVDAKVKKCSRDNHYEIDFNAYDSAATFSVASDKHSTYVKLSKQGSGASTVEYKFYSPVAMKGRFWLGITGNTTNMWDRASKSGDQSLYYTYNDPNVEISDWKNEVTFNGNVVDFDNATYNVKGEDIKFAELMPSDFGTLSSSTSGELIYVPFPEMTLNQGLNTLSLKRLTGYAFNMHTFTFKGDLVA